MATRISVADGGQPRIIVDCTHTYHTGAGTGIQRVVRRYADALLQIGRESGIEVVPSRVESGAFIALPIAAGRVAFPTAGSARESPSAMAAGPRGLHAWRARGHLANRFLRSGRLRNWLDAGPNDAGLHRHLALRQARLAPPEAIALSPRDVVLSLDSSWVYDIRSALDRAGAAGVTRAAVICDVLPLSHPEFFTEGTRQWFGGWLRALLPRLEGVVTISEATRQELLAAIEQRRIRIDRVPASRAVHLGAELEGGADASVVRAELRAALGPGRPPAFLTVGTLEPRKNVDFAIDVFDALVARGLNVQWHVVGAAGWLAEHTAQRLRSHPEHGARLFWWTDLSDAELAWCYRNARALVAASRAEGFGLPLVEARMQGLAVFASDIPVFREVLGAEGRYLPLGSARLAAAILEDFLVGALPAPGLGAPSSIARPWVASARELLDALRTFRR